jgi:hypothetical protein
MFMAVGTSIIQAQLEPGNRLRWLRMAASKSSQSITRCRPITRIPLACGLHESVEGDCRDKRSEIDEFKGRWTVIETLAPERLTSLRRIATIESVGSSTRIEGAKLTDAEVETLLSGLRSESFASRDEQEVAAMQMRWT